MIKHTENRSGMKEGKYTERDEQVSNGEILYNIKLYKSIRYAASAGTDLRIARDTFCFQGLSLRMPMPKPERKNSSPVVTRSHFCEASNSSTAESQMKACSLLLGQGEGRRMGVTEQQYSEKQHTCGTWPHPPLLCHLCYQKSRLPPHRQMKSNAGRVEICPPLDSLNDVFAENLKKVFFSSLLIYVMCGT